MVFHYSKLSHLASSFRPPQHFTFTRNAFPSTTGPAFQATNSVQQQPQANPSTASSSHSTGTAGSASAGSSGPGAGGSSKWSAGSRVPHWGFQQVRLVTQPASADPSLRLADDEDDTSLAHRRAALLRQAPPAVPDAKRPPALARPRRNSTSLSVVEERVSSVEVHRRYWTNFSQEQQPEHQRQASPELEAEADEQDFIHPLSTSSASARTLKVPHQSILVPLRSTLPSSSISARALHTATSPSPSTTAASIASTTPPRADLPRKRRNSTSALADTRSFSPEGDFLTAALQHNALASSRSPSLRPPTTSVDDAPRVSPPERVYGKRSADLPPHVLLFRAAETRNLSAAKRIVDNYLANPKLYYSAGHTAALSTLTDLRVPGSSIEPLVALYEQMFEHPELRPTKSAYRAAIRFFCARDREIVAELQALEKNPEADQEAITRLRDQNYLASALSIFKSLETAFGDSLGTPTINRLIQAAAERGRLELAISLFSRLEQSTIARPTPETYEILIAMFATAGEKEAVKDVFEGFVQTATKASSPGSEGVWRATVAAMFKLGDDVAAVGLLERMLKALDTNPAESKPGHRPGYPTKVSDAMLGEIIRGFAAASDIESAKRWFARVKAPALSDFAPAITAALGTGQIDLANEIYFACTSKPTARLQTELFTSLVDANLARATPEYDTVASQLVETFLKASNANRVETLPRELQESFVGEFYPRTIQTLAARGAIDEALPALKSIAILTGDIVRRSRVYGGKSPKQWALQLGASVASLFGLEAGPTVDGSRPTWITPSNRRTVSAKAAATALVSLNTIWDAAAIPREPQFELALVHSFLADPAVVANNSQALGLDQCQWFAVFEAFALVASYEAKGTLTIPFAFPGFEPVVDHYFAATRGAPLLSESERDYHILVQALRESGMPEGRLLAVLSLLDPQIEALVKAGEFTAEATPSSTTASTSSPEVPPHGGLDLGGAPSSDLDSILPSNPSAALDSAVDMSGTFPTPPPTPPAYFAELPAPAASPPAQPIAIDPGTSHRINELGRAGKTNQAYSLAFKTAATGLYPHPDVLGKLIELLGREGKVDQLREAYLLAYAALAGLDADPQGQSLSWVMLEDHMIIGLAHAGHLEDVAEHRLRLLQQGSAPSADGYAAMILNMHETTNDAAVAVELFEESQRHGVAPNVYLFNTLISKLSRARRAREVLEYFELMKVAGIQPTAITYGAVINACCKTGDDASAEYLFQEMVASPGFRPRVPPYNTLIQFFTHTKPSRERALYYYDQLLAAGVQPTGHTYKLLLDAYGTVGEPDLHSMSDVFEALLADTNVTVTGAHWASLITAWGTVHKDLERALAIFASIAQHPSTRRSRSNQPDAVVYESLLNALVANGRADLCQQYVAEMKDAGVHMTAYVANSIIRAYAVQKDMEAARAVFESMADPGSGVAAVGNHLITRHPKNHHAPAPSVPDGVVYREPSTWDTMVRVELAAGELERAKALLVRVEARAFPEPVVERIRKMVADAQIAPV